MNLEEAGHYASSLGETVTEDQFTRNWYCWRVDGKWFMLTDLDIPESQISLKLPSELAGELMDEYDSISPAVHMNKPGWYEVYLDYLDSSLVKELIKTSFNLVVNKR